MITGASRMGVLQSALKAATSGVKVQNDRMLVISQNLSNAQSPGYRRQLISFGTARSKDGVDVVKVKGVTRTQGELPKVYRPEHPDADADGYIEMTDVNPLVELADARQTGIQYTACTTLMQRILDMMNQALALTKS